MTESESSLNEQLLKISDVAKILNISLPMAYRLVQRKEIPAIRIHTAVRVTPSDLQAYIDRSRTDFPEK